MCDYIEIRFLSTAWYTVSLERAKEGEKNTIRVAVHATPVAVIQCKKYGNNNERSITITPDDVQ